jgi:phosphatidylinositol 4-kinase
MKTQVRDHLNHLRERAGSTEEMQALALSEYLVDPERGGIGLDHSTGSNLCTKSAEDGSGLRTHTRTSANTSAGVLSDTAGTPIQKGGSQHRRTNSTSSTFSLGQWSSPAAPDKPIKDNEIQRNLQDLRARLDAELLSVHKIPDAAHRSRNRTSPLPYGSDQEDDPTERSQRPPRSQKTRSSSLPLAATSSMEQGDESTKSTIRSPPVVFRESWSAKEERIRQRSAFGDHPGWHLLPIMIKANDDLRQEQLASQLIQRMSAVLAREKVPVWLCPYEIIALTDRAGIIEAIPDTISLDALKKNGGYTNLCDFFHNHFGVGTEELAGAKANFVESLAAYSIVCFLLQIKDRHNGNILLDTNGHIIHIDFGFFFLSSPGKNAGFESAPWKLTREAIEVMGGIDSHLFRVYRELCVKTFLTLRKRCMEIILLVEMLKNGNEELQCFRGRPDDAIRQLRERFRLDLNDRACREYVQSLVDDSIENWRTDWYDRYQRYFVGIL